MSVTRILILALGVFAAIGAFIVAKNMVSVDEEIQPEVAVQVISDIQLTEVLVATKKISAGSVLDEESIEWKKWPSDNLADEFITIDEQPNAIDELSGLVVHSLIFPNEPISSSKLVKPDYGYISAILPSGQRAVATSVSIENSAGGFILPNDRVDVIMMRRQDSSAGEIFLTETILKNIRVLAIDQKLQKGDEESFIIGETATLQLSPKQAEILTAAQQVAERLTLSLRSLSDNNEITETNNDYLGVGVKRKTIRVIRSGNIKQIVVDGAKL